MPRLLDLFCGAGGCAMGYHRAGFEVVGVDIKPQPRYPFSFVQGDALKPPFDLREFDVIHASPPCQSYSRMSGCRPGLADKYSSLIDATRSLLSGTGKTSVIENVSGAPLAKSTDLFGSHGVELCGSMFGLPLYRHRIFESNVPLKKPPHPPHDIPASKAGHWKPGTIISVCGNCAPISEARRAMEIDWMSRDELAEAIPPAYTEYIGKMLLKAIEEQ